MGILPVKTIVFVLLHVLLLWFNLRFTHLRPPETTNGTQIYTLNFIELAKSHGRVAEWHNFTTEDGYILSAFRLPPNPLHYNSTDRRGVIYLQHPFIASSDLYVVFGPGRSLAYALSDVGYDVWLGNLRGNTYSRQHTTLSPDDSEFWNFSMDEWALRDLPATIDYVLKTADTPTLSYIGHSLGSTIILMMLSDRPDYNDKLNSLVLMAPVSYWTVQMSSRLTFPFLARAVKLLSPSGAVEFQPRKGLLSTLIQHFCPLNSVILEACYIPYNIILGTNREQFQMEETPYVFNHWPAGISAKAYYHYHQHMESGKFAHYNYETKELNLKYYGDHEPPEYNVTNVAPPKMVIFQAQNDPLATDEDIKALVNRLPGGIELIYQVVEHDKFNHGDFVLGKDAEKLVYKNLIEILTRFH